MLFRSPIIAVDGYFTNKDSIFVVGYLKENIKQITVIPSDSAQKILGKKGEFGIISISTNNSQSEMSRTFRAKENILFKEGKNFIIDEQEVEGFSMNSLISENIVAVEIFTPLKSAQLYGESKIGGVVKIRTKDFSGKSNYKIDKK